MKYFFLSEGWVVGRMWELGGLWDENSRRRSPEIHRLSLGMVEQDEILWLYQVEEAVLMIEVKPGAAVAEQDPTIGQVVLKRLISAEQAIEILQSAQTVINDQTSSEVTEASSLPFSTSPNP